MISIKREFDRLRADLAREIIAQTKDVRNEIRKLQNELRDEMHGLRQTVNLVARQCSTKSKRIRCLFLVHAVESWDAQIEIWRSMKSDDRFEPLVASINRKFPGDGGFGGESETSAALDELGVPHLRLGAEVSAVAIDILRGLAPDIIFRQSQWEADVPPEFSTKNLGFARLCCIPYSTPIIAKYSNGETGETTISPKGFDQYFHRMAWRVFCETELTRNYFLQFQHSDPSKFIVSGYPKLDVLLGSKKEYVGDRSSTGRFKVIWAPHWSIRGDWLGFGTFDKICADFLEFAKINPGIDFAMKPHPALFKTVVSVGAMSSDELGQFICKWEELANCSIESGPYSALFAQSDMMVTDGISFLTEYPVLEKPLVFIDSGRHVPMNSLGDLALSASHTVFDFDSIAKAIEYYRCGGDWKWKEERTALLEALMPNRNRSVAAIVENIVESLRSEGWAC
ncbi:hypothetical protein ACQQ2Q_21515 [Agrobacterium sp. ES01]|uniref:hypothetical protein n=1 Tax=Agrobacterium sp. ES01 TaxID=3420714 RepID=UPI003D135554